MVTDDTTTGTILLNLVEQNIAAICAHTNLDAVSHGVNDVLAERLGLTEVEVLAQDGIDEHGFPYGIGRVGTVSPQSVAAFAAFVQTQLGSNSVRFLDAGRTVARVAVGGGACGGMLSDVLSKGCDTFVTADIKYDVYLEAKAKGVNLLDAGHFATEQVICPVLANWISEKFPDITVSVSERHCEVYGSLGV